MKPLNQFIVSILLCLSINVAFVETSAAADSAEQTVSEYHGFHIDSHLLNEQQIDTVLPSLVKQLIIVESVGLPNAMVEFFKGIPIVIDPSLKEMPGQYTKFRGSWLVRVQPIVMPENKPIVLHELLHAYHHQVLSLQNPDILNAYRKAKQSGVYPDKFQSTHFLENEKEYFAVMGTIYLFGNIQQPPFNCEVLSKTDPEYLTFLAAQFGPHACK